VTTNREWFNNARYALFIHYGLYSLLERGECVMNKEQIPVKEYAQLANKFTAQMQSMYLKTLTVIMINLYLMFMVKFERL
jgi:hypothetical protein